jgi:ribosome-associated protein
MKHRAAALAGSRLTNEGVIVMQADRFRTQAANRQDALDRLTELLEQAARRPVPRRPTKPSRAARARRVEGKVARGSIKANRRPVRPD